jgi:hypothetical protein
VYAAGTSPAGEPEHWRFGVGVATQNMIDGQATTNLEDFDSYHSDGRAMERSGPRVVLQLELASGNRL